MTQVELADRSGVSASQVSLVESDARVPSLRTIAALAAALEVPAWLLTGVAYGAPDDDVAVAFFRWLTAAGQPATDVEAAAAAVAADA